ncbi:TniB family NTP-binding protein [Novosphingobium sp.]|uniref:TniB family NTP-binding protein n=1 Tax=Novosphingobium sp. TaxID=1874826 RepID=UPI002FE36070
MIDFANMNSSQIAQALGKAGAAFNAIRIPFAPQDAVVDSLEILQAAARHRQPGIGCGGAMLIAPYGSGKTVAVQTFRDRVANGGEPDTTPVLLVETSEIATVESLPTSILAALGAPQPASGSEKSRWARAITMMTRKKVEVVVFDEFNRASRRPTMSKPMARAIRERIMDAGVAEVVFCGSDEAKVVLRSCPDVLQRLDDHIDLEPLDPLLEDDLSILADFLEELDTTLVAKGLLRGRSSLDDPQTVDRLCRASGGALRLIMKTIRAAMLSAIQRGSAVIEEQDLFHATALICVGPGHVEINPFA